MKATFTKRKNFIFTLLALLLLIPANSCEDVFRTDPFHGEVPEELSNCNGANINRLTQSDSGYTGYLRIALISDSHRGYDELQEAISLINRQDYDLVVHLGDFTQSGLFDEYRIFAELATHFKAPLITIPGKHDYLASGQPYFSLFFGQGDNNLVFKGYHLIFWDNCVWERTSGTPNTGWLSQKLEADSLPTLVFCHLPPWSEPIADTYGNLYLSLMLQHQVLASVHGHLHDPYSGAHYGDGIQYSACGSTLKHYYSEVTIVGTSYSFQTIAFE